MSAPSPFSAESYTLELAADPAAAFVLTPMPEREASALGAAFAAIDPWTSYGYPASALAAYLKKHEPGAPRFLLTLEGEVAGALGLRVEWLRGSYIQFLGILPPFQRRGLGRTLLAWIEAEARAVKDRNLWVAASDINVEAIRFYERHGFAQTARLGDLVYDGRTEILLRKRL
jgi:ribosomal protein S18 acetylase RimI-like enzyme